METDKKTIVVTGCNKGIGYGLVEWLAQDSNWNIIMACRNLKLAEEALQTLKSKYPNANLELTELDISNFESIDKFVAWLKSTGKQVDVFINNAALLLRQWTVEAFDSTLQTNFHGTAYLTQQVLPLIADNGKIISVSSTRAQFPNVVTCNQLKTRWSDPTITKQGIIDLVSEYRVSLEKGEAENLGYLVNKQRFFFYPLSKLALSTFVKIFSKRPEVLQKNIQVYNLHPGYICTDMSRHKGTGTIEEGIDTLKYLVQLPFKIQEEFQGQLFENRVVVPLDPNNQNDTV